MSQWRRVALEAVPSCKQVIEEADSPGAMWSVLYDELSALKLPSEVAIRQIYEFALRCFRDRKPEVLASEVWVFFHYVVGAYIVGNDRMRDDLPKRISISDFHYWAEALKGHFAPDKFAAATKQFEAAKHNPKDHLQK